MMRRLDYVDMLIENKLDARNPSLFVSVEWKKRMIG